MKLPDVIEKLSLRIVAGHQAIENREITGGYVSDLLSDVMANAGEGNVWVTSQSHQNIVAVASLLDLSAVILAGGIKPDEDAVEKAEENNVVLLTTDCPAFDLVGRLYSLGVRSGGDEA